MDTTIIIYFIFGLFIVLLGAGMYIHSVLLVTGLAGLILLEGFDALPGLLGNLPFRRVASYTLTTIPLFVLMAQFLLQADIVKDLFYIVNRLARGRRGVLGALTIAVGGVLGAVSGSGTATSAALGQVAVPELKRHGYSDRLAGAIAASAGSLSGVIPPSIILILYGVATETPVGNLFIGSVFPGMLMTLVFIAVMLFYFARESKENRRNGVVAGGSALADEQVSIARLVIVAMASLAVILIIFAGIYSGFFTPTEAGAVGSFVALLAALLLGKVNFRFFRASVVETIKITGLVMLIMIGAQIFARFVSLSLLPRRLIALLQPIMDTPVLVLAIIAVLLFIMFMFLEGAAVILMSIPVLLPIMTEIQVDLLWFGVFVGVICTIGLLTPPVGLSVYAVAGVTKIRLDEIFAVAMVFAVVAFVVVSGLLLAFPALATYLPTTMK